MNKTGKRNDKSTEMDCVSFNKIIMMLLRVHFFIPIDVIVLQLNNTLEIHTRVALRVFVWVFGVISPAG